MEIKPEDVKKLRDQTSIGFMQCKRALVEADGDFKKAVEVLRKQGLDTVARKSGRATKEGRIGHYVHSNHKIGVLLELNCETDFVASGDDFKALLHDLCMQVAATHPSAVAREQLPKELIEKEKEIYRAQFKDKPDAVREKIVEGKLDAFYKQVCLLEQPFIKSPEITVKGLIDGAVAKLKENIQVRRFARFELGKDEELL